MNSAHTKQTDREIYRCPLCREKFTRSDNLGRHLRGPNGPKCNQTPWDSLYVRRPFWFRFVKFMPLLFSFLLISLRVWSWALLIATRCCMGLMDAWPGPWWTLPTVVQSRTADTPLAQPECLQVTTDTPELLYVISVMSVPWTR